MGGGRGGGRGTGGGTFSKVLGGIDAPGSNLTLILNLDLALALALTPVLCL